MTIQQQVHITRQQADAASAIEREAYNALASATNEYCKTAETQHDWDIMERRFKRTKAGAALVETWKEAKRVQDVALKANMAALNQFWSGFGLIMGTASLVHMFNHGEQETELYQHVEAAILADYPPVQPAPVVEAAPTEQLAALLDAAQRREAGALTTYYELEAAILAAYPAVETLTAYTLRVLRESPAAPVAEAAQTDIVTRLEDAVETYSHLCDCDTDLYQEAADEIRRLRAEVESMRDAANGDLFKERKTHANTSKALRDVLNGYSVTSIRETESGWAVVGKSMGVRYQSADFPTKEAAQADAAAFAQRHDDYIRRQNQR